MAIYENVFSNFEIKDSSIKFDGEEAYTKVGCVGSIEEEMETITVTKKCEGLVVKSVTRGTGSGELTLSLHIKYDLYVKMFGMESDKLKEGVVAYGKDSRHNCFSFVARVLDEDGNEKLIAYPNLIVQSGIASTIENGAEEVAEIEITVVVQPDENGFGKYEAIASEIDANTWLTSFTPELVKKV